MPGNAIKKYRMYLGFLHLSWELVKLFPRKVISCPTAVYLDLNRVQPTWFLIYMCLHFLRSIFMTQICLNLTKTDLSGLKSQSRKTCIAFYSLNSQIHTHMQTYCRAGRDCTQMRQIGLARRAATNVTKYSSGCLFIQCFSVRWAHNVEKRTRYGTQDLHTHTYTHT